MKKPSVLFTQTLLVCSALLGATQLAPAATDYWIANTDANWSSPGNWTVGNAPPQAGDSLIFGDYGYGVVGNGTLNNDLNTGLALDGITFAASAFTLNGDGVLLTGQTNFNTIAILNSSGVAQTIGMPLVLDWGYYTFSSSSGGSVALNGGLTLSTGGVAYFDNNVTSTALTTDLSGLIAGLGGAGLIYNPTTGFPTGLATINGSGDIVAYPSGSYNTFSSGTISGNNVELTASGAAASYNDSGATVNTITATQAGSTSVNTDTDTLTTTGTLTLGQQGGIYALNAVANAKGNLLTVTGGSLTAGTTAGATIVFGANGTTQGNSPPNMMTVSSVVADNAGGAVSVVKVGTASMNYVASQVNTYSGGTYVLQGQLQCGANTALGNGPLYVAPGATVWLLGLGNYANNMYISPGNGSGLWNGTGINPGALLFSSSSGSSTLSGTVTLLGAPVTAPTAGCRLTGDQSATSTEFLNGQITGTGTLDLNAGPHATTFTFQNQSSAYPNNWAGGLIIEESLSNPSSARTTVVNLGGAQTYTQIPHGAGAGDVTLYAGANSGSFIASSTVTLNLNGLNTTINGLNGTSAGGVANVIVTNINPTSCTLTVGDNNASGNYGGVTLDSSVHLLSLTKIGTGTQTFTGALGHHGNTTVNAGTFALSGGATIANTPLITVASPGTLDVTGIGGLTLSSAQTLNCVGTVNGFLAINGTVQALDSIGTLTNIGNMTLNNGGSFVWDINNATGTPGSDPGWSMLNVSGQLQLGSLGPGSFTIKATSLSLADATGSAPANFSPTSPYTWKIAYAAGGIAGFSASQFVVNTSGFVGSAGSWTVSLDNTGDYLQLNYNPFQVIVVQITPATETVNQGGTASFYVVANPAYPATFAWTQNGNPLVNGGQSAGGAPGNVTIATTGTGPTGITNTLTITGVDSAVEAADGGSIDVTVTEATSPSPSGVLATPATLTVIDTPYNPNVAQSQSVLPPSAGSLDVLTASASGTSPFTYQWYLNGNEINGATASSYTVKDSPATAGSYTVVIGNASGSVTSSATVITGPVSVVPNQIVYEPFNYPYQTHNPTPPQPAWDAFGVTNLFNQATGAGLAWLDAGNVDFTTQPSSGLYDPYTVSPYGGGTRPILNDEYPVYGLAGNDPNAIYADSDVNGGQVNLPFGTAITSGTVYGSFVVMLWGMNQAPTAFYDYLCGFDSGANNSTTHSVGLYIQENTAATFPNVPYTLGVFKGNLATSQLNPGVNGNWSPNTFLDYNVLFVVFRLNLNNSPATCDLWINPPASSFYASEANLPAADVSNAAAGAADVAGGVSSFYMKITQYPVDRLFGDVRIGTTWASVTPPSAPTLSLANQILTNPVSSTVVFASQNAGNPVSGSYQWTFNNGSGPVTLTDTTLGDGAVVSGSLTATLTIVGATASEAGTYTVTGSNTDPSPGGGSATLTGSASALLTATLPALSIISSPPNVVVSWPANWAVALQATTSLTPPITWTPVAGGESSFLYWPSGSGALAWAPVSPLTISGTDYTVTVAASPGEMFFQLVPSP